MFRNDHCALEVIGNLPEREDRTRVEFTGLIGRLGWTEGTHPYGPLNFLAFGLLYFILDCFKSVVHHFFILFLLYFYEF